MALWLSAIAEAGLLLPHAPPLLPQLAAPGASPRWSRVHGLEMSAPAEKAPLKVPHSALSPWGIKEISPNRAMVQRVEGMSRKTWKFNDATRDRVHVALDSEGRPITADIQLWIGPDWTPFMLKAYSENGKLRPIQTLVGTRNKLAMIEVRNTAAHEFPFDAVSNYAEGPMQTLASTIPSSTEGTRVDGGALRSFPLNPTTKQLEVVLKTDGRQLNAKIELLNGPNNAKQTYEVFTNNGELNSLCVAFNTIDPSSTVRIVNLATLEFPCYIHLKEN
ncbi:hypothetical protein AB1Y20_002915 [Prymnesium parvum]|uniref:Beta-mannosidase n=1 Tax=Prymnesium parvum TaxID=97485 RepID=A0AB34JBR4_PRYPA|mmetsp:Transcript_14576/g.34719  ORF Transcript_14576/g.34719 Transcript_14576/m.34719 type:complete len:276 (-) Transcript_14576:136-963(-)